MTQSTDLPLHDATVTLPSSQQEQPAPDPARTKAPKGSRRARRSRQCRGARERNFVRAQSREADSALHSPDSLARIVDEAAETGALALFRRRSTQRAERLLAERKAAKGGADD